LTSNVAIIGCGPAGLMAAHAAVESGREPIIYSPKVKSTIFGAMFLHRSIPGITPDEPELNIRIRKIGSKEGYARKVYGSPYHPVSWDKFESGGLPAWSLGRAYDKLWEMYNDLIIDQEIKHWDVWSMQQNLLVLCTAPAPKLCRNPNHEFRGQKIWVLVENDPREKRPEMVYDGRDNYDWYRYSHINGTKAWEYSKPVPLYRHHIYREVLEGVKPLGNDCDCHPGLIRLGRFGKWEKDILTHHAYEEARALLEM
jgi:hypothetical protein